MEFTFHNSYVILELVPITVMFCIKFSCWRKSYSNRAALFLGWRNRYKNSTVVIINWLIVTKYPFLKWQWIFSLLYTFFIPLSPTRFLSDFIWVTRRVSYKKQELLILREHLDCKLFFCVVCVWFFFLSPMFPVFLDCSFLIATSVFTNVCL